jgi:hypothetical protein
MVVDHVLCHSSPSLIISTSRYRMAWLNWLASLSSKSINISQSIVCTGSICSTNESSVMSRGGDDARSTLTRPFEAPYVTAMAAISVTSSLNSATSSWKFFIVIERDEKSCMSVHPWAYSNGSCTFLVACSSLQCRCHTSQNGHITLDCTTSDNVNAVVVYFILLHLCCQASLSDSQFILANSRN